MNWGYKILLGFSTFVLAMLCMVYVAMQQTNEMIDDNYYEKELKYQSKIDASKNLSALAERITIADSSGFIKLGFPAAAINNNPEGSIEFIRSSAQKKDVLIKLNLEKDGVQLIPKSLFIQGLYELRIDWKCNGVTYFHQQKIIINK